MMKNPKINRAIGYIVMFIGFFLFWRGFHSSTAADPVNGKNIILIIISLVLIVGAIAWMIMKVRCPHCNKLLNLKLGDISQCPYCGENTDIR